ncbi:MAG: hypothetical protein IPP83_10275 [Flavobacteriales bacterium]|nr:hypothetical protein [Flavobacteriales bacterium]
MLKPPAHIYFPNAFTPDGDARQFFGPVGHYIEEFQMTVFDRWEPGGLHHRDVNIPWDGSVDGRARP